MTSQAPDDRRARTRKEIIQLIEKRNAVLAQFYSLAKYADDADSELNSLVEMLEEFCQELVDYMAIGHFELYRRIEEGNERRDDIIKLAEKILPRINVTTQIAVAFNDLYDSLDDIDEERLKRLPNQLANLGEELATRIDLEDQLINTLLAGSEKTRLTSVSA